MDYLVPIHKAVTIIFAVSAVVTGGRGIVDPAEFAKSFGLSSDIAASESVQILNDDAGPGTSARATAALHRQYNLTMSYVSLMGVRQLATGIILLTFAYQEKWTETATILAIIGILVAGTDGIYLLRAGKGGLGRLHAIPGAAIATLATAVLYTGI